MIKNIIYPIVAWALCMGSASADNIVINDVTIPQGGTAYLPVGYSFTSTTDKVGFTFKLNLPDGISIVKDEDGDPIYTKDETSIGKLSIQCPGEGNFAGLPSNSTATIKGTEGTLLTLVLSADESLAVGSSYDVTVTKCTFQQRVGGVTTDILLDDFTFKVTIDEPDDGRLKFDEQAAFLPAFSAGDKANVTVKRTIKAGIWNTLVLPFTLPLAKANAVFGSDAQFAEFSGFSTDYADGDDDVTPDDIIVNFTTYTLTARKPLTGGKPYLVKVSNDITEFEVDDVTMVGTIAGTQKTDEWDTNGRFTGSFVKTTVPEDGLFISDNNFWYSTGNTSIKGFRCWLELDAVLGKDTSFEGAKVSFVVDDELTAIEGSLQFDNLRRDDAVYDLQGRKVSNSKWSDRQMSKGIYIVNGQKKVIK